MRDCVCALCVVRCGLCAACVCGRAQTHSLLGSLGRPGAGGLWADVSVCVRAVYCVYYEKHIVCSTKSSDADQHARVYVRAHTCALTRISMRAADIFTGTHSKILPTGEPGDLKIYVANCGDCRAVCVRGWGAGGCESERGSEGARVKCAIRVPHT